VPRKRKLRFVVSVRDFGARGDGYSDDTAAFLAAARCKAQKIKVPPGIYTIRDELELDPRFISTRRR
jgi:polygalacturonase